jgi:hypothetical protein
MAGVALSVSAGADGDEMSFAEYRPEQYVSFKNDKTQKVTFDPRVKVILKKGGQYGDAWVVPVEVAGNVYFLRLKSKRLVMELKKVKQRSLIEITQSGTGFDTTYTVKVLSK